MIPVEINISSAFLNIFVIMVTIIKTRFLIQHNNFTICELNDTLCVVALCVFCQNHLPLNVA